MVFGSPPVAKAVDAPFTVATAAQSSASTSLQATLYSGGVLPEDLWVYGLYASPPGTAMTTVAFSVGLWCTSFCSLLSAA